MAQSRNREREAREARDRLRVYNARQTVHAHQRARRRRDNVIAVAGVLVVAILAAVTQVFYFTAGPGAPTPSPSASPSASASASPAANVGDVPAPSVAQDRAWTGSITLNNVKLGIKLDGAAAPQAVASVVTDIKGGYYVGKTCHRELLDSDGAAELIQCGSLDGTGAGDPSYQFGPVENAPSDGVYPAGTIAMARGASEYSMDHQFFIMLEDTPLGSGQAGDPGYTVIGTVTSGLSTLAASAIATAGVTPTDPSVPSDGAPVTATKITAASIK